jgi:hypothetical protein
MSVQVDLTARRVLVTGAASGIGAATLEGMVIDGPVPPNEFPLFAAGTGPGSAQAVAKKPASPRTATRRSFLSEVRGSVGPWRCWRLFLTLPRSNRRFLSMI